MAGLRKNQGFTIVETLIASVLLGVIMMSAISIYVAAQRFFNDLLDNNARTSSAIAVETIIRRAQIGNTIVFDAANNQIKLRLDFSAAFVPNQTPGDFTDDTWFKYSIIGTSLRWRTDTTQATDVSAADPELETNLVLQNGSAFNTVNPSGAGVATVLNIIFITQTGTPPVNTTLETSVAIGAMPKN